MALCSSVISLLLPHHHCLLLSLQNNRPLMPDNLLRSSYHSLHNLTSPPLLNHYVEEMLGSSKVSPPMDGGWGLEQFGSLIPFTVTSYCYTFRFNHGDDGSGEVVTNCKVQVEITEDEEAIR
ncbi:hypothetical protein NE237_020014 [Protea cynaroides]|uniref:Uncharacterized protein n=1 Tax=Protea cynaroides TaxID=273540 RepID=A0A9Q0H6G6_9MAGN|nr:hypothetical protein NE237_020014 [Protea cynaroides]